MTGIRSLTRALLLTATAASCTSPGSPSMLSGPEEATALPPIKVDLPPPPSFAEDNQPLQYPDGTMSIFGLRKQIDKYLGKDVKVKAYLLEIYQCPVCPKGQQCKLCDQPHFFLSDKPDGKKEKSLMTVDYLMPKQKPPFLTVGKQYTLEGTFARNSPTGFAMSDGLLQFTRMTDDKGAEFVSPAAALEAQALKGEAAEAAAFEKAAKIKQKNLAK
ncbi:MAG: hypothetical protein EXR72_11125 [Myxococcales bacterium]|nr:hypothetical protein [Myxococcales bacterium]